MKLIHLYNKMNFFKKLLIKVNVYFLLASLICYSLICFFYLTPADTYLAESELRKYFDEDQAFLIGFGVKGLEEGARYYIDEKNTLPIVLVMHAFNKSIIEGVIDGTFYRKYGFLYTPEFFLYDRELNMFMRSLLKSTKLNDLGFFSVVDNYYFMNQQLIDYLVNTETFFLDLSLVTLNWTSDPVIKYYIPYPFVASGNFQYQDYWWLHIVVYYYWLWFFFIYLIVFYLIIIMWEMDYNMTKNNPQRETRGVSRSKCGDLITALVPVSWASAIIIHESTDAIDHFDGFGTLDFVVGVRAFQWGWEYYYPNNLKINYLNSNDRNLILGNGFYNNNNDHEYSYNQNLKHLPLNKKREYNILPLFLITNHELNREFFNLNKMNNFGFSKLCIFNAYKHSLKGKSVNYNNILSSNTNLTNFNLKKFLNNYNINSSNDINFSQLKLPTLKTLKLFKKNYNKLDLNEIFYKSTYVDYIKLNLINKSLLNLSNFNKYSINLLNIQNFILNNKRLSIDSSNYIEYTYNIFFNLILNKSLNFNKVYNINSLKNIILSNLNLTNESSFLNYFNLNPDKYYLIDKLKIENNFFNKKNYINFIFNNYNFILNNYYADLDFKRISNNELLEDIYWDFYINESNNSLANDNYSYNYKINEIIYKTFGRYDLDKNIKLNHLYQNTDWYNNFKIYFTNLNSSYYVKTDNLFKNLNLFSKINFFLENSFINNKSLTYQIINSNLNSIMSKNEFFNIINSSIFFNSFSKFLNYNLSFNQNKSIWSSLNNKNSLNSNLVDCFKNYFSLNNSIWKVFKYAYYDNRFFINTRYLSFVNNNLPIINNINSDLTKIINKNIFFFNKTINFNKKLYKFNNLYLFKNLNLINLITYDLQFDLSSECDLFKYSWIDWYGFYNKKETKFQDLKEYNLNGSKLFFNKYDYFFNDNNELNLLETYFNKILNNRKNYTNLYNFIPYLLYRNNSNNFFYNYFKNNLNLNIIYNFIFYTNYLLSFDKVVRFNLNNLSYLNNINSFFSNNKNYFSTLNYFNNYYNYLSLLNNVLVKKNLFIKVLLLNNWNYNIINSFNLKFNNKILMDWKSILFNNTNINYYKDYNLYYYFRFSSFLEYSDFFIKYTHSKYNLRNLLNYDSIKKTQYNHMRKSINNMLRLQNDKAICMPTDTRIQLLTWSKDIIHSWAIPSAGIKIDCIPGYSSHKVFNLTLSGIYYGQCMEICGRFHHWMPIVVYFVRRDLFLFWCTTFLNSKKNETTNINKKILNKYPNIKF